MYIFGIKFPIFMSPGCVFVLSCDGGTVKQSQRVHFRLKRRHPRDVSKSDCWSLMLSSDLSTLLHRTRAVDFVPHRSHWKHFRTGSLRGHEEEGEWFNVLFQCTYRHLTTGGWTTAKKCPHWPLLCQNGQAQTLVMHCNSRFYEYRCSPLRLSPVGSSLLSQHWRL